jgi:hypothetical protein
MASGQAPRPEYTRSLRGWWSENLWLPLIIGIIVSAFPLAIAGVFEPKPHISITEGPALLPVTLTSPPDHIASDAPVMQAVTLASDGELSAQNVEVSIKFISTNDSEPFKIYGPKVISSSRLFTQVPPYRDYWQSPTYYKMNLQNLNPDESLDLIFYATQRPNLLVFVRSDELTAEKYMN